MAIRGREVVFFTPIYRQIANRRVSSPAAQGAKRQRSRVVLNAQVVPKREILGPKRASPALSGHVHIMPAGTTFCLTIFRHRG